MSVYNELSERNSLFKRKVAVAVFIHPKIGSLKKENFNLNSIISILLSDGFSNELCETNKGIISNFQKEFNRVH